MWLELTTPVMSPPHQHAHRRHSNLEMLFSALLVKLKVWLTSTMSKKKNKNKKTIRRTGCITTRFANKKGGRALLFFDVTDRGDQVQIKWRFSDEDRFQHVRWGVPRFHCYHNVLTCPMLKADVWVYMYCTCTLMQSFPKCISADVSHNYRLWWTWSEA